ncbi:MAG: pantothenate kinase [Acidobacteria bacterium]|nr:MAG: pantothenate kinase [Acidobacteriota bacterium]PIE90318.1 MAG: pantothenate kinase [Acidobacteriota bacterium]
MLLAIDVGNTNTVIGLFEESKMVKSWRLTTSMQQTVDEYGILFSNLFLPGGYKVSQVKRAILSCVVPTLQSTLFRMCQAYFHLTPLLVGPGIKTGVELKVDNPREVGADRIVNSLATYHLYGGPAISIDFGTATTFDPISEKGAFLGGAIAPGLNIAADALYAKAAKLPKVEIKRPARIIGKNTVDNIQIGLYYGYKGLVKGILEPMIAELGGNPVVVATGGLGRVFAHSFDLIQHYDPHLTLKGLYLLDQKNR